MSNYDYEVAVVGAGPAGATLARELALRGTSTVLLDRERLPRLKSCAGGIPARTAALLPFSLEPVIEDRVATLEISYWGRRAFRKHAPHPLAFMVMRDRFDNLLCEKAVEAGVTLLDGCRVRDIQVGKDDVRLVLDKGRLRCRYVAGADGANSVVARALGLGQGLAESVALEAEVRAPPAVQHRWRGVVNVDLGYRPCGYGWVFPKADHLSIGLVLPVEQGQRLQTYLYAYLRRLGLSPADVFWQRGHKIRFRRADEWIAGHRALLLGDAAGLADEFTEEGIFYAVRSGIIAARALTVALAGGDGTLAHYQQWINREIMPELRAARVIARLFYWCLRTQPALMLTASQVIEYLWQAFFRVQAGRSTYDRELRKVPPLLLLKRWEGNALRKG